MTTIGASRAGRWFKRVMWLGIAANLALAVPTLLAPGRMLALGSLSASPLVWPRFAGLLLILLSVFYMPAAIDPDRYRAPAWIAVAGRLAGFVFFLGQGREYLMFGLFDLAFCIPEAILLARAVRSGGPGLAASAAREPVA